MKRNEARGGFTLLEILVVLALFVVLLGGVGAILRLYSGHYTATERRVSSAQLVRSISQMLSDDLGAAVQDPIQEVGDDPNRQFIRRFGLRGDSRSLQIDVVQPNLFASTATPEENRRIAAGEAKSPETRQAPELKTVFYEFVPINATEPESDAAAGATGAENALLTGAAVDSATSVDGESVLTGSLSAPPSLADDAATSGGGLGGALGGESTAGIENGTLGATTDGTTATRRFVRKYGLSRRELDFETPEDDSAQTSASTSGSDENADSGVAALDVGGTLTGATGAIGTSAALGESSAVGGGIGGVGELGASNGPPPEPWLTAARIALDSDDGTTWAPEVLDCRFSYFDGENWLDSWDSIEKSGLPVAIKVELKLAPLDDVDLYRASPMLFDLPLPPTPEELAKLAASVANEAAESTGTAASPLGSTGANESGAATGPTDLGSRLTGSLSAPPTSTGFGGSLGGVESTGTNVAANANGTTRPFGTPAKFDVFNSYRPLESFRAARAALLGLSPTLGGSLAGTPNVGGVGETTSASTDSNGSTGTGVSSDLTGGLGGASPNDSTAATTELGSGAEFASTFPGLTSTVATANLGPVYNDEGICVDYANGGRYATLERMAVALGVPQPTVREAIVYLPTTPLGRTKTIERRRSTNVRVGTVAAGGPRGNAAGRESSRERRAAGANPYSTGRARRYQERERTERTATDRTARTRETSERSVATRSERNRTAGTRTGVDRNFAERAVPRERGGTERVASNRVLRTRGESDGGTEIDSELAAALDAEGGVFGSAVGSTEEFGGAALVGGGATPDASGLGAETLGAPTGGAGLGLGGAGVATVGGISPFEIVDSQTQAFADGSAGFAPPGAAGGGANLQTGLIETPGANPGVVAPTQNAQTSTKKTQQTWIRGKK